MDRRKVTGLTSSHGRRSALNNLPPHASLSSSCRLATTAGTRHTHNTRDIWHTRHTRHKRHATHGWVGLSATSPLVVTGKTRGNTVHTAKQGARWWLGGRRGGARRTGRDAVEVGLGQHGRLGHGRWDEQLPRAHVVQDWLKVAALPALCTQHTRTTSRHHQQPPPRTHAGAKRAKQRVERREGAPVDEVGALVVQRARNVPVLLQRAQPHACHGSTPLGMP
jgi:hypothetical protein